MHINFITLSSSKMKLDKLLCIKTVHQLRKLPSSNMEAIHDSPAGFCSIKIGCLLAV